MADFYFDSSGLVKLYVEEVGSEWVEETVWARDQAQALLHRVVSSKLIFPEAAAAIAKAARMGVLSSRDQRLLLAKFVSDHRSRFSKVDVTDAILARAVQLTQRHKLRGYDAVHLATALLVNEALRAQGLTSLTFVSSDSDLCLAAQTEKLTIFNPDMTLK